MTQRLHPAAVLYPGGRAFPALAACEHYAGSEKLIRKALQLQGELAPEDLPVFDVTADCEDGAPAGAERDHAQMVSELVASSDNAFGRLGVRVHDMRHAHWQTDLEIILGRCAERVAYVVFPKVESVADAQAQLTEMSRLNTQYAPQREIPAHVLIETAGALHDVWAIAALPGVESIDFGLMDFVSAHHGAIPGNAMRSPGQFDHPLIARAKCDIALAALGSGVVPSHNVSTELHDMDIVSADARRAREQFGYLRMWSIHPKQIEPIVTAMRPDVGEVHAAAEILVTAQDANWGPTRNGNTLHDRASYRYYWELLGRAHATGVALDDEVRQRFFV